VRSLLRRSFDVTSIRDKRWLVATFLVIFLIYLLVWAVARLEGHAATAEPHLATLPVLFALFLLLAAGEEIGWTGYVVDPLQDRWGALGAAAILAVPWWLAHLPSMTEIGATAWDMAWWAPGAVALRILMLWLYNNTGKSIFAVILFHALLNLGRVATYPASGAHYDSFHQAAGYTIISALALAVLVTFGSRRLARRGTLQSQ
jgi:membrane protease YdiL (CAAX protease family)